MPTSATTAQSIWRMAIHWAPGGSSPFPSNEDLRESLAAMLLSGEHEVDSLELSRAVMGDSAGGSLLSLLLWHTGLGQVPMGNAHDLLTLLLENSASPNKIENGYRPVDMLVVGMHNSDMDAVEDMASIVELLVRFGMNHDTVGKFSSEEIESMLRKDGVLEETINTLIDGCKAVELDDATPLAPARVSRRTL